MRRAALPLPENAERSGLAAQYLATHGALLNPAATLGGGEPISDTEQTWISDAYRAATLDGATTITRLLRLPGAYPQHDRAQYLVQRYTPDAAEELPGLRSADPTTDTATAGPDADGRGRGRMLTQFLTAVLGDELYLAVAPFYIGQSDAPRFVAVRGSGGPRSGA
jgi:hypothetical protein